MDEDNWGKLKHLLRYIKYTVYIPLIPQAEILNIIKWWSDASYEMHQELRSHTVATISFGKGLARSMSK